MGKVARLPRWHRRSRLRPRLGTVTAVAASDKSEHQKPTNPLRVRTFYPTESTLVSSCHPEVLKASSYLRRHEFRRAAKSTCR